MDRIFLTTKNTHVSNSLVFLDFGKNVTQNVLQHFMTQTATIRQVRHDFGMILDWIANGDEVTILRYKEPVAQITPVKPKRKPKLPPLPDYEARARRIFGNRVFNDYDFERMRAYNAGEISEEELLGKSKP